MDTSWLEALAKQENLYAIATLDDVRELTAKQAELEAELKNWKSATDCMKLNAEEERKEWQRTKAENERLMEHIDELEEIIAFQTIQVDEMEAQIAKLREAAQAVVETDADARRQQITHWKNPTIDTLAAALEASDE